jgi:hypothetical protein
MQIARRLRAMIVNLADTLPAQRHPALHQELNLLDRFDASSCILMHFDAYRKIVSRSCIHADLLVLESGDPNGMIPAEAGLHIEPSAWKKR